MSLPVHHVHDPVALLADALVMRHDHEGQVVARVQIAQQIHDFTGCARIKRSSWLVCPDDRRFVDDRARDGDPLALPAREFRRSMGRPLFKRNQLQRMHGPLPRFLRPYARYQQRQFHILDRVQHRQQVVNLEHESHPPGPVCRALAVPHLGEILALQKDLPAVDPVQTGQAVQERRLAATGWTHHRHHLAPVDSEIDILEGLNFGGAGIVGLVHVPAFDHVVSRRLCIDLAVRLQINCHASFSSSPPGFAATHICQVPTPAASDQFSTLVHR